MNTSYKIDRNQWSKFSLFEQMGNIGSEIGRTFSSGVRNDTLATEQAVERALDLFKATIEPLVKMKSPKTKEILRAKEQFLQIVTDGRFSSSEATSLDRYFLHYALAARSQR